MLIYLYGDDSFRSHQYLQTSLQKFRTERDPQGYNTRLFDAEVDEEQLILTEIMAVPFLAPKRMVVVKNLLSSGNKTLIARLAEKIEAGQIPENTIVIVWQGESIGKSKEVKALHKRLTEEKYAKEFNRLTDDLLLKWIAQEVKTRGGIIEIPATEFIRLHAGADMWQVNSLLDQLVAYASGRAITRADVQLFLEEKIDDNVFALVEAIMSGQRDRAFRLLEDQRRIGMEDGKLFGLLLWQFRVLTQIADLLRHNPATPSDAAAKELDIHPFVAKKNYALVQRYPYERMRVIYDLLLESDRRTKTGQADQTLVIDVLVARVASGR